MLAPLRFSTGLQIKLIEAMAAEVPVVTTPSAAGAAGVEDDIHVLVAEGPRQLADAVLKVLEDPAASAERARRARKWVRERFSWSIALRRLEHLAAGK
jgi:glycosyltransferase involved in cell wall biosynthesis